jgi:hypothetical protein
MNSIRISVLAFLIVTARCGIAYAGTGYETGVTLLTLCDANDVTCFGYIEAVSDVMIAGNLINGYRACMLQQLTLEQLRVIVTQYLYRNASQQNLLAVGLIADAFAQNFPCH